MGLGARPRPPAPAPQHPAAIPIADRTVSSIQSTQLAAQEFGRGSEVGTLNSTYTTVKPGRTCSFETSLERCARPDTLISAGLRARVSIRICCHRHSWSCAPTCTRRPAAGATGQLLHVRAAEDLNRSSRLSAESRRPHETQSMPQTKSAATRFSRHSSHHFRARPMRRPS